MNKTNFARVVYEIKANPSQWGQTTPYHNLANNKHDFVGFAHLLCPDYNRMDMAHIIYAKARQFLNVADSEAQWLFSHKRTFSDFEVLLRTGEVPHDGQTYSESSMNLHLLRGI